MEASSTSMSTTVRSRRLVACLVALGPAACSWSDAAVPPSWITSLKLVGPPSIAGGAAGRYTATATIARAANLDVTERRDLRVLVKNDPAGDQEIARVPVAWGPFDSTPKTIPIDIACRRLDKGAAICPPSGARCLPNPAVTYAMLDSFASARVAITCVAPPPVPSVTATR
jgi:hypothetical protein